MLAGDVVAKDRRAASRIREGRAALIQPLNGTDLLPPVGSPAARNIRASRPALAFREKAHRSIIIPPSPIAVARNGCDLSVLLKYKDLYFGGHPHYTAFTKFSSGTTVSNTCL
jgi:hypothetical protein